MKGMDIADALADCTDTIGIGQAPSTLLNKEVSVS